MFCQFRFLVKQCITPYAQKQLVHIFKMNLERVWSSILFFTKPTLADFSLFMGFPDMPVKAVVSGKRLVAYDAESILKVGGGELMVEQPMGVSELNAAATGCGRVISGVCEHPLRTCPCLVRRLLHGLQLNFVSKVMAFVIE